MTIGEAFTTLAMVLYQTATPQSVPFPQLFGILNAVSMVSMIQAQHGYSLTIVEIAFRTPTEA